MNGLFRDQTMAAIRDRIANPAPPPPPERKFNAWGLVTALPRGLTEAAAQVGATVSELVGGAAQVQAATDPLIGVMAPNDVREQLLQGQAEARDRMAREGVVLNNEIGDSLRTAGRSYRPDPLTAHKAEELLYGFARGAAKIVGGATVGGPMGVVAMGGEEAMSAADDLAQQGVPFAPRAGVGAVQGTGLALAALPVVGTTLQRTAALYALGGPVGFMGQQALSREILRQSGQNQVAEQYDPLDPVGLAVSTLLPAGFAAYGLRAQRLQRAYESLPAQLPREPGAEPVQAEAQGMTEPPPSARTAVADAVARYPEEVTDAAMVLNLTRQAQRSDGVAEALARAETPEEASAIVRQAFDDLAADLGPSQLPAPAAVADDLRFLAQGAGWAQEGGSIIRDPSTAIDPRAADAVYRGDVVGRTQWIPHEEWFGRMRSDLGRDGLTRAEDIQAAVEKAIKGEKLLARERRTVEWMQAEVEQLRARVWAMDDADDVASDAFSNGLSSRDAPDIELTARAAEIDPDAVERAAIQFENDDAGFRAEMQRIVRENRAADTAAPADQGAGAGQGGVEARGPAGQAGAANEPIFREMTADEKAAAQRTVVDLRKRTAMLEKLKECLA